MLRRKVNTNTLYITLKLTHVLVYVVHRLDEETQRMVLDEEELTFGCGDGRTDIHVNPNS